MTTTPPPAPAPQQPSPDRALLIFVLSAVGLVLTAALLGICVCYPALATPLQVATGGAVLYASLVTLVLTRR
ncbi:hypothetical protein [Streptomyces sp. NPDC053560]|uniref:hypothetical protein n=1 Tax=Streptomyces sp. NPDC053560 TaxID=3365711 RepID=UPI0037CFA908